jgi:hypothetical protein
VRRQILILEDDMREIKEPGPLRKLLSEMGGRSWLLVTAFVLLIMGLATYLVSNCDQFQPEHWLGALTQCKWIIAALIGKRVAEEVGSAISTRVQK